MHMDHFNPYIIILLLFTLTGLASMGWGWQMIVKARRTRAWPTVPGHIVESTPESEDNDLLPHIVFRYTVEGRDHTAALEYPRDLTPDEEFRAKYLAKYPAGATAAVYYDPTNPARATLEPGFISGDWMVFAIGLGMAVFGVIFLLSGSA